MRNKNLLFIIVLISCNGFIFGQQFPQYSQYLRNQFMVNPGAAGVYDFTDITLSGRSQWIGLADAPKTSYISVTAPLNPNKVRYNPGIRVSSGPVKNPEIKTGKLKHALGFQMLVDQYGAFQKMGSHATYSIHLPITKSYNLSFGTRLGILNNTFIESKAIVANVNTDMPYQQFVSGQLNRYTMDLGTGLYLYSANSFFGISADHMTKDLVSFGKTGQVNFDTRMQFNFTGGYKLKLNDDISITPAVLVKYMSPAPIMIEGSAQLEFKEWIWAGVSYRNTDAMVFMAGLNITNKFKFGYSYDSSISRLKNYSSGSHELVLGIMLGR